ncbi:MAG: archease [Planctomycetes bacterium]|nr:archease [Planctomycetota bacterium]
MEPSWETIDHTADVGVRVRAPTLSLLFSTAARAMYSLCLDPDRIEPARSDTISLPADGLDELLLDWLREILARLAADRVVYARFEFGRLDERGLEAAAAGEPLDATKHRHETELKAVTAHGLSVRPVEGGWEAQVIFDV